MKKILTAWIMIIILLSACSPQPSVEAIQTAIAETELAQPTATVTDKPPATQTPPPTNTPSPPPTPTVTRAPAFIPGADPDLLINAIEELEIDCTGPTKSESGGFVWVCKDTVQAEQYDSFYAFIYGRTETSLDQVLARAVPLTVENSHQFITKLFGYLSTMPYDNSTPTETRQWVETTLSQKSVVEKETYDASGVTFTLDKNKTEYRLEIGKREAAAQVTPTSEAMIGGDRTPTPGINLQLGKVQIQEGPVTVQDVAFYEKKDTWYFIGYLENSADMPASLAKIVVTIRDSAGKKVASNESFSALDDLYTKEKSPFLVTLPKPDATASSYDVSVEYKLLRPAAYKFLEFEEVKEDAQASVYTLTGKVKNNGNETAELVKVVGLIFDSSGKMLGWAYTYADEDNLEAGDTSTFRLAFTSSLPGKPASYELFVEASASDEE